MNEQNRILAVEHAHLLHSLRASDFDIPSAIGELIDNSIQAEAKKIQVKIEDINAGKRSYKIIDKIICGDDGQGMDGSQGSTLHSCIKLGYSTRFDDRKGIGRFGVGMTLAGIRFATKIEVYSKLKNSAWHYVMFDLNDEKDINVGILAPIKKGIPEEYSSLVGKDQGTLVIWSGFDKFAEQDLHSTTYFDEFKAPNTLDPYGNLNHWLGRTFRIFLWNGVELFINNQKVFSFDPLYINKQNNKFPDDDPAELLFDYDLEWPLPRGLLKNPDISETSKIKIKISLLPKKYREISGRGGDDFKGRYINENEGISILRKDREVFYDTIPHFGPSNKNKITWGDKDRWWGCEISFLPDLDEHFTVKNIKRGALPVKDLKIAMYEKIKSVRERCIEEVEKYWKENQLKKETKNNGDNLHKEVEKIAKIVKTPDKPKAGVNLKDDDKEKRLEDLTRGLDEIDSAAWKVKFGAQPFTLMAGHWKGDTFIDMTYVSGTAVLQYNLSHIFFEEMRLIKEELENLTDPSRAVILAKKLDTLTDILLMSFVKSRQGFSEDEEYPVKTLLDFIVRDWGRFLSSYTEAYKKEESTGDK